MSAAPGSDPAQAILESLRGRGFAEVEVFEKSSRSRRTIWEPDRLVCCDAQERGWAVRASDGESSFHLAATGTPDPRCEWPAAAGPPLRLPTREVAARRGSPPWDEPADLDAPLLGEGEAVALLRSVGERLTTERSDARLLLAELEDGSAELTLRNGHGVAASHRARVATLELWATLGGRHTRISAAARDPRRLPVGSLARRLADQLVVGLDGRAPEEVEEGPAVLAGEVVAAVLEAAMPLWIAPRDGSNPPLLEHGASADGRLGSSEVTIVDDGRWPGGLLSAPVDGEGVATGRLVLVERGLPRATLRSWREAGPDEPVGSVRRPGWRDLPRVGPSHLLLEPSPRVAPSALLEELGAGHYLLGLDLPPRLDWTSGRLELAPYGFRISGGGASRPIRRARVSTTLVDFFSAVRRVARDLRFVAAGGGCVGAPSVLVERLRIGPA